MRIYNCKMTGNINVGLNQENYIWLGGAYEHLRRRECCLDGLRLNLPEAHKSIWG